MSVSYKDGLEQARVFLRENKNRLQPQDWILVAEQSRQHFSRDRPLELIADITGNGTGIYTLTATIASWVNKFSKITKIEHPVGMNEPVYIDRNTYTIYRSSSTVEQLKLFENSPSSSESMRMTYTVPHTFSETDSTIEDMDKMLFGLLLAAYAALALSADFLKANRSQIPNDSVDFSQKSKDMGDLSDKLFKQYGTMLAGQTEGAKTYACATKDYDMKTSFGEEYIVHDKSTR